MKNPNFIRSPQALAIVLIMDGHVGKANSIRRLDLLKTLRESFPGASDRAMRLSIEYARHNMTLGAWICSTNKGEGYYRAADRGELLAYYESEKGRALSILARIHKQVSRALPDLAGQMSLIDQTMGVNNGN
jgi:hypothetical protein